ncbi:MAG: hypothetical protein AAGC88_01480 [Bacteroidota bacterium]
MNVEELKNKRQPDDIPSPLLKAMWLAANDDWKGVHDIAQYIDIKMGARVHGYLHWVEGDLRGAGHRNADCWNLRVGTTRPDVSFHEEWHPTTTLLLQA